MQTPKSFQRLYTRSNYRLIGKAKHSALKPCHWMVQKLLSGHRNCYKGYFGIQSEKCIQCTPALPYCTHNCAFCWRDLEKGNLGTKFTVEPDEPSHLIKEFIRNQVNLVEHHFPIEKSLENLDTMEAMLNQATNEKFVLDLNAFRKKSGLSKNRCELAITMLKTSGIVWTNDNTTYTIYETHRAISEPRLILESVGMSQETIENAYDNAHHPSHAAISLAGEPLLYPPIADLVAGFRKRSFTTFIVSNGTMPDVIEKMHSLPSQFYFTLPPPSEQLYKKIHRPSIKGAYAKIKKTLELIPSLNTRTCLRITLVKGLNGITSPPLVEGYVKLITKANPNFVDIKGFAVEARALNLKKRLGLGGKGTAIGESAEFAPTFEEILEFAKKLSEKGNFPIVELSKPSRNVLLLVNWPEGKSYIIKTP
ncbi:MAG: radical SAM protein [Promethearchaeota archaeon]